MRELRCRSCQRRIKESHAAWDVAQSSGKCPSCGTSFSADEIRQLPSAQSLVATKGDGAGKGGDAPASGTKVERPSEGVRRLSIFAGGLGAFVFFAWAFIGSKAFSEVDGTDWLFLVVGLLVSFLVPWAFVRAVGWVVRGFTQPGDKER